MPIDVLTGDCRTVLASLDGLFDSAVTDPPYELGFMGRAWDRTGVAFQVETWRAVFDRLKPGAHLIAFSGTRTYHRMAVAIEDAGFEIRDQLAWAYGSGYPKSLDIAKAIAKRRTEDAEPVRVICRAIRAAMDAAGLKSRHLVEHFGGCNPRLIDHWAARDTDSQPALPTPEQWQKLRSLLPLSPDLDAEVERLNGRKGTRGERWTGAEIIGEVESEAPGFGAERFDGDRTIRALDPEAARWQGWGTAIKPAWEPICLARKPLDQSTIAANVLAHGTGALNIDGCRIEGEVDSYATDGSGQVGSGGVYEGGYSGQYQNSNPHPKSARHNALGRFPANLIHDGSPEVFALFPDTGASGNLTGLEPSVPLGGDVFGRDLGRTEWQAYGDSGSAARFFYSAKAGPLDRLGSDHPTVKPVDLMRWLVRMVTPPGGRVLDPFAGSGTTGIAALAEGFDATLIDLEPDHVADIERKLAGLRGEGARLLDAHRKRKAERSKAKPLPLFGAGA